MRILLTYFTYPPAANGVARFLGETTKALLQKGHDVEILTGDVDKAVIERHGKLRIHRLPFYNMRNTESGELISKKFLKYLIQIHKQKPLSIIEAEGLIWEGAAPYALALNIFSLTYNVPVVLRFHGIALTEFSKSLSKNLFWRKILNVCNKGTEAMYSAGISVEKLETQYNGIDTTSFKPELGRKWLRSRIDVSENDFLIGTASRIITSTILAQNQEDPVLEEKGIIDLIKAFGNSLKDKKDAKLIIAAATPPKDLRERFEKAKQRIFEISKIMNVKDKVIVKEFALDDMPRFYNGLDIFVLASHSEAFPMVLLEAGACHVPIISTTIGGIPELIENGESGFLFEPKDTVALGRILRELIKSPKKRENAAALLHKNIKEKFDILKTTDKMIGSFKSIIEAKKKATENKEELSETMHLLDKKVNEADTSGWRIFKKIFEE